MRKIPRLENWYTVQLTELVICGQIYGKKGIPKGFTFHTGAIWGLQGNLAVCKGQIFKDGKLVANGEVFELGNPDKVWVQGTAVDELDKYEI